MNDPGLDEPIKQTSKGVEQDRKDELDFQREDEQAFLTPRYNYTPSLRVIKVNSSS